MKAVPALWIPNITHASEEIIYKFREEGVLHENGIFSWTLALECYVKLSKSLKYGECKKILICLLFQIYESQSHIFVFCAHNFEQL